MNSKLGERPTFHPSCEHRLSVSVSISGIRKAPSTTVSVLQIKSNHASEKTYRCSDTYDPSKTCVFLKYNLTSSHMLTSFTASAQATNNFIASWYTLRMHYKCCYCPVHWWATSHQPLNCNVISWVNPPEITLQLGLWTAADNVQHYCRLPHEH